MPYCWSIFWPPISIVTWRMSAWPNEFVPLLPHLSVYLQGMDYILSTCGLQEAHKYPHPFSLWTFLLLKQAWLRIAQSLNAFTFGNGHYPCSPFRLHRMGGSLKFKGFPAIWMCRILWKNTSNFFIRNYSYALEINATLLGTTAAVGE